MALERLQKIIARAGLASRRKAEQLILDGRVKVNGRVIDKLGVRADASKDHIKVNGRLLHFKKVPNKYFLAFKPVHVITSLKDPQGRPTIDDLLRANKIRARVFPVGRLDWDADGLLLLTNDGDLANQVMHPRKHLQKKYRVRVKGHPDSKALAKLSSGVTISGIKTLPAQIHKESNTKKTTVLEIVLEQGRYHQIKLMLEHIGHKVLNIRRIAIGPLKLRGMRKGQIRKMTMNELRSLKKELSEREDR